MDIRQGIAKADEKVDADQRLNPGGKRISDGEFVDDQAMLFEQTRIDTDVSYRRAEFPAGISESDLLCIVRGRCLSRAKR